ncbi:PREDICTED: uncharacterized protein LOC107070277 [Polistes dominula]|uniref:Uncharacterized protein LOC107070277 n=1 Tax=Polistes dominula TaxID=743375 RepID=A0ABM1IUB6_POLDO|nr:PREDICTED: uncharacterized protein LOC107070277 [Polistes dominula]
MDESRDFLTRHKIDYPSRIAKKSVKYKPKAHYPTPLNILNGPYKYHLNTSCLNETLPLEKRTEDPRSYTNRVHTKYPHLKKFILESSLNEELFEEENKKLNRTVYQIDYSKHLDDFVSLRDQKLGTHIKRATLPDNWIIPETVQKRSFRNPWEMIRKDLLLVKVKEKPANNLDPNPKEREILRVKTGKSEYEDAIGKTGNLIMREKPYGLLLPIETSAILGTKDDSNKKSECSIVLTSKNIALPSNIF